MTEKMYRVAVVGAGPAGLFAAREMAKNGAEVTIFNRDIKPGGLAEYGIYPDKFAMKDALRNQFRQILEMPNLVYYGNIRIGQNGDLSLDDLRELGYQAILVTVGAQGTKKLGLPGEGLPGVYHAKDVVYHYNRLPPFSQREYIFGKRVAVVGAGNVMMDIARFLIQKEMVRSVTAIVRRGPMEVKFDKKETEELALNIDLDAYEAEVEREAESMRSVGQDPAHAGDFIEEALSKAQPTHSNTRFKFRFLSSPSAILGDDRMIGLRVDENELVLKDGAVGIKAAGRQTDLQFDSVVFAIGDTVEPELGLPLERGEYAKNPSPVYPQEGISFEAYDPANGQAVEGVFMAGWARQASSGLVGYARKDGTLAARAMLQYLQAKGQDGPDVQDRLRQRLIRLTKTVVSNSDILKLDVIEQDIATEKGLRGFKFASNQEMLEKIMSIG